MRSDQTNELKLENNLDNFDKQSAYSQALKQFTAGAGDVGSEKDTHKMGGDLMSRLQNANKSSLKKQKSMSKGGVTFK